MSHILVSSVLQKALSPRKCGGGRDERSPILPQITETRIVVWIQSWEMTENVEDFMEEVMFVEWDTYGHRWAVYSQAMAPVLKTFWIQPRR